MDIVEYATVLQDINSYTVTDPEYPTRLFESKLYITTMVDKVYANHGKYKYVPTLEEPVWEPENHVPKKKLETIIELGQILEMLRYQDDVIQRQALDIRRISMQGSIIQKNYTKLLQKEAKKDKLLKDLEDQSDLNKKYIELQKKFDEQQKYVLSLEKNQKFKHKRK